MRIFIFRIQISNLTKREFSFTKSMIKNHANVILITYESCLNFFEERKLSNHCFELEKKSNWKKQNCSEVKNHENVHWIRINNIKILLRICSKKEKAPNHCHQLWECLIQHNKLNSIRIMQMIFGSILITNESSLKFIVSQKRRQIHSWKQ